MYFHIAIEMMLSITLLLYLINQDCIAKDKLKEIIITKRGVVTVCPGKGIDVIADVISVGSD
jgi:hypothetical protein